MDYRRSIPGRRKVFFFASATRPVLGPTEPLIQLVPGIKRKGREADYSLPSSAEVKNAWSYISTPQYDFFSWCLIKQIRFHCVVLS
jgi:hypothetical protein